MSASRPRRRRDVPPCGVAATCLLAASPRRASSWHRLDAPLEALLAAAPRSALQVKNGTLTITAKAVDGNVTSARLTTAGNFRFTYGRVLIRARLPEAPAAWPAFWLLGTRPGLEWPDCGEIDILEKMGHLNYHMACGAVHNGAHNFLLNASG